MSKPMFVLKNGKQATLQQAYDQLDPYEQGNIQLLISLLLREKENRPEDQESPGKNQLLETLLNSAAAGFASYMGAQMGQKIGKQIQKGDLTKESPLAKYAAPNAGSQPTNMDAIMDLWGKSTGLAHKKKTP